MKQLEWSIRAWSKWAKLHNIPHYLYHAYDSAVNIPNTAEDTLFVSCNTVPSRTLTTKNLNTWNTGHIAGFIGNEQRSTDVIVNDANIHICHTDYMNIYGWCIPFNEECVIRTVQIYQQVPYIWVADDARSMYFLEFFYKKIWK